MPDALFGSANVKTAVRSFTPLAISVSIAIYPTVEVLLRSNATNNESSSIFLSIPALFARALLFLSEMTQSFAVMLAGKRHIAPSAKNEHLRRDELQRIVLMRWERLNLNYMISEAVSEIHGRYPLILRG